ncbi:hypothetical protein [Streptomyces sp. NPDC001933]|uniref:hypothetical protein n=1 Tax=Streptomyces sp. NPDC001933 TaxID=3364626 RepID=UPI0036939352
MPTWFQADLVEALHRARTMRTESDPVLIVRAGVSDQHQWIWTVYRYEEFLDRRAVKAPPTDERG